MNNKILNICILLAFASALGCHRKADESHMAMDKTQSIRVYSENELNRLILPGTTIADITNIFGLPGSSVSIGANTILLTYMFTFEERQEKGPYLTGFGIDIKDGRVARWSPVTGMTGVTARGGESQGTFGEQTFSIYLTANDSATNIISIVRSQGSADASSLKLPPDLTFKAKVFAGDSGSGILGEQSVILVVSDQDASKLKELTQDSFGKHLIIVCHNKVIAIPVISSPLSSRQITFTIKDSGVLKIMKSE